MAEVTKALARVVAALPGGGEVRAGQEKMAIAIAAALSERRHLIIQAGTGCGHGSRVRPRRSDGGRRATACGGAVHRS